MVEYHGIKIAGEPFTAFVHLHGPKLRNSTDTDQYLLYADRPSKKNVPTAYVARYTVILKRILLKPMYRYSSKKALHLDRSKETQHVLFVSNSFLATYTIKQFKNSNDREEQILYTTLIDILL
jgi:hypothetical protein